jgi:transposase
MAASGRCEPEDVAEVVSGVDTHMEFHVAVVLDRLGRRLGESKALTTLKGYRNLLAWAKGFGPVRCAGVEGAGSYGALSWPAT